MQKGTNKKIVTTSRECAYVAVMTALLIAAQLVFAAVPGVEVVSLLLFTYAFVFGWRRGMVVATAFSLLRQLVFGFFPSVFVLYLVYYNAAAFVFGWLGKKKQAIVKNLPLCIFVACLCAVGFTLLDNCITPLWYGYSERARELYFEASLPVMVSQILCVAASMGGLFLPLSKAYAFIKNK